MSKAILVLDEMPKSCFEYELCEQTSQDFYCASTGDPDGVGYEKPDWCPLKEAEPVRHGSYKMIVDNSCWFNKCSVCGNRIEFGYMLPPYCPNCGAKMDGGTE